MTKKSKDVRLKQLLRLGICVALIALIALIGAVMVSAEEPEYSEGLVFVSNGDGTCILKGIGTCTDTEIVIPPVSPEGDVVTEIYSYAIYVLDDLKSITIPASVTKIGEQAFDYCAQLTSIIVEEGNPVYHSDGNCLIHTESKTLIKGCPNSVIPDDGSVTCIGNGAFFDYDNLTSIVIPEGVVSIENDVFSNCNGLTSVTIPSTVTSIGSMFCAYSNLTSITVAEGNPVYHCEGNCLIHTESKTVIGGCSNSVIPADGSVASIGKAAFEGRTSLKSIVIPSSVSKIDWEAFEGCSGLASVTFEKGSQLVTIEYFAFAGCRSLKSIDIPEGVTILKDFTFAACENLESISFSSDLQFIDSSTFSNCEKLIQMENGFGYVNNWVITSEADIMCAKLRDGTVGIAASAFLSCEKLTRIGIPSSVRIINDWMFDHIDHLAHIYYGGTENEWESKFVRGETDYLSSCFIHYNATFDAQGIVYVSNGDGTCYVIGLNPYMVAEIVIPSESPAGDSVTSIGFRAFAGTTSLKSVVIPSSVSKIDWEAFEGSSGLTSVTFSPNSRLTVMEDFSFAGCSSLTSFIIPDGVTEIPGLAFAQCRSMTSITIPNSVTSISIDAFNWCDKLTDVFYEGTEVQWKAIAIEAYNDPLLNATIHYNTTLDENGILYTSNGDGTCYVSGSSIDVGPDVVIPSVSPAGDLVTRIGDWAFHDCYLLERLTLPEGLLSIGSNVIAYCPKLFSITIPASVTRIDDSAFYDSLGLKNVYFAEGSRLTSIGKGAFGWCRLTAVTLPEGLQSIDDHAFCDSGLQEISLPSSVENIGYHAFNNCPLTAITVAAGNPVYHSDGNCLIHTASKTLVKGSLGSVIPKDGSVTTIGESAFWNYDEMTAIGIPSAVTRIEYAAFGETVKLEHIYYYGTESEWNEVAVDDTNGYNDTLRKATVHFLNHGFRVTSASLTLGDSLTMNYYAKADPAYGTPAMRFTYRGETETVPGVPTETEGEYVFSLTGIAPQCMGENIKAELILTLEDGTELVVDAKASYSVREYCDDVLAANPDNKALATLLADLLAYGDAAQDYTDFNADTPVSEGFAAAPSEWEDVTDTDFTLSDKTRDDLRFTSAGVRFGHINRLYFKVKAADLTGVTLTVNGKTYTAAALTLVEDTTDTYILYTDPIYATEFDKVFTAELSVDGEVIQTLTYSVKSYVYAKQNSENTEMAALVRALYAYGRSAIAYKQEQ